MIKKLTRIFPSLIVGPINYDDQSTNYKWFITEDNEVIGIHNNDLTNKNTAILTTFLHRLNTKVPVPTEEELKWKELIKDPTALTSIKLKNNYRFVFFSINNLQIEPRSFNEAIQELFDQQVPIIWDNEREGIIVEKLLTINEAISYKQIIDILMSDLYVKIKFFVGPSQEDLTNVHDSYKQLKFFLNVI